ncbi:diacylglycerol o-acyltransferase, putative [Perkinsus marinus ATCC 50983]|uniref:Acyltransferase n=1 Tax=Perkinsus marinus (strain ATCC 50983 / TXsc) TaxID=423536 RepID=C5KMS1_PERM5|nr:diacylglycerol o-acyltransferase, putative [Perkinsus marinus ATCC 50983]EER14229.1 diacylglycerol o-acyltransferase, putative [Perkinsus marinus ATCC 50983]|eukprot:XP_002782434.1 diacylglycerol o-acyltransferase, putative [Perkinsus marinus ATCC 50983]
MTEFKKAEDLFDRLLQAHETLVINHLPKANSSSRDELPPSKEDLQQYNNFENLINQCGDYILKFKKRLLDASKNPDVAVYGPKMKTKVEGLIERYEQVYEQYQDIIQPLFEHAVLEEKDRLRREEESNAIIIKRRQKDKKDAIEKDVEQKAQWAAHFDKTRKEMERAQQEREAADKERADAQDAELIAKRREEEIRILSMDEDTKRRKEFKQLLESGKSCVLITGGFHEATITCPGTDRIYLNNSRKGFVRYALREGYSLTPVYGFGETDTFSNVQGMWAFRFWLNSGTFQLPADIGYVQYFLKGRG